MSLLDFDDTYKAPFKPKRSKMSPDIDNFYELQNFGRTKVTEDLSDKTTRLCEQCQRLIYDKDRDRFCSPRCQSRFYGG